MAKVTVKKKTSDANKVKKSALKKAQATARSAKKASAPRPAAEVGGDKLTFNHAMVYAKDVQRALGFYRDLLGFKLVDEFRHEGKPEGIGVDAANRIT